MNILLNCSFRSPSMLDLVFDTLMSSPAPVSCSLMLFNVFSNVILCWMWIHCISLITIDLIPALAALSYFKISFWINWLPGHIWKSPNDFAITRFNVDFKVSALPNSITQTPLLLSWDLILLAIVYVFLTLDNLELICCNLRYLMV